MIRAIVEVIFAIAIIATIGNITKDSRYEFLAFFVLIYIDLRTWRLAK